MGCSLATAALARGHDVVIVSGPVQLDYPAGARVVSVVSTREMLEAARNEFGACQGLIGVAAPCDYEPVRVESHKIAKTGQPLMLQLIETPDVVATLAASRRADQWVVGFALETDDHRLRALAKLERKSCDLMVSNGTEAMDALATRVEILAKSGETLASLAGSKEDVAQGIFAVIEQRLVRR